MKLLLLFLISNIFLISCFSKKIRDTSVQINKTDSLKENINSEIAKANKTEEPQTEYEQENILSVETENERIMLTMKNIFDKPIYYGSEMTLQKWNDSKWQNINFVDTYIFVSIEYILQPHDTRTHPFYFSSFKESLTKGNYRIIKNYYFENKIQKEEIIEFKLNL